MNQTGAGLENDNSLLEYDIVIDGQDEKYDKFHRTHYMRKIVLKHNIDDRVVVDRMRPHDMCNEIAKLYSKIVKPVLNKYTAKDIYSVLIENKRLDYPIFLGKH